MQQFADDLAELLVALDIREPITFCGLSMGGYVAWQFWQRHAERLGRLILCDTRAIADDAETARGRLATAERVLDEGAAVVAEPMLPKLFAAETLRDKPALVEATRNVMLATPPASIAAALRGMAERPNVTDVLSQINVPSLVLCGEHDAISGLDEMRAIAAALPNAQFVKVPAAGHMAPLENPEFVNAAFRAFVESA